jgi:hypothetical protein
MLKVTVPVGTPEPEVAATVAVSVHGAPAAYPVEGLMVRLVAVGAAPMVTGTAVAVLVAKNVVPA